MILNLTHIFLDFLRARSEDADYAESAADDDGSKVTCKKCIGI